MAEIEIPDEGCRGIKLLIAQGEDRIAAIREALDQTGPSLISNRKRAILINEALGGRGSVHDIELILNSVVYPLRMLQFRLEKSGTQIHAVVSEFIEDEIAKQSTATWTQKLLDRWNQLKSPIVDLLASKSASIETKSIRLLRSRSNQFRHVEVYSDCRPLFDEAIDGVEANLITNTIQIAYQDNTLPKVIHLSLDPKDLDKFEMQIQRAKQKNVLLRQQNDSQGLITLEFEVDENEDEPVS